MSFKKTIKQKEAVPILSKHKYTALYGGSRSGKTFILIYALVVRASKVKSRHCIVRKTFNSIKRSVWLDTLPKVLHLCFPNLPVKYNKTDFYITLPNGSEIWIAGLDDNRVDKILGMEFSTLYFNEASELEYHPIQTVISRLAEKNSLSKRVWFDFNPPAKTHWSYWLFIKKVNPVESEPLKDPDQYSHLLMNPGDNLENIDEEYLSLLGRMPEKDRQRFLEGQFSDADDGLAYYAFKREEHVRKVNHQGGTLFIGMDFNVDPMTAVVCQVSEDELYVMDEVYLSNSDTFKMAHELKKKKYTGTVIPDSTGKNRKTSGQSDHEILRRSGFTLMATRNPFVTDRVNNINRLLSDGKIIIDPKCKRLINDLEKVSWKDNKLDQKTDSNLTHISDALGYAAWKLLPLSRYRGEEIIVR